MPALCPVVDPFFEVAVHAKVVLLRFEVRFTFVVALLQMDDTFGVAVATGKESTCTTLVMESLHPSVEILINFTL